MTITAAGTAEVHASQRAVLIHASTAALPAIQAVPVAATGDRYSSLRHRVFPDADDDGTGPDIADPGMVVARNIGIVFHQLPGGEPALMGEYADASIPVPLNANGIIYLIVQLSPFDVAIAYAEELPDPVANVYVRTLANVTRGSEASAPAAIRQRCFGTIVIPSMDERSGTFGLFG